MSVALLRSSPLRALALCVLLVSAALAGCSVPTPPTEAPPDFELKWGAYGSGNGQFQVVTGVAVDNAGNVYVTDSANDRVQKFSASGVFLAKWGSFGNADGQLKFPTGIAVDGAGNVLVADTYNHRIQVFSPSGAFLSKWGSSGAGPGQFVHPRGIAVDASGNVYVTDNTVNRIQKFTATGGFLAQWGSYGSGPGQVKAPRGIAVDASGGVFVADYENHRIQRFTDGGVYVGEWGGLGTNDGQFVNPYGVATDADGNVYVSDVNNHRVQKFSGLSSFLSSWGTNGVAPGKLDEPYGIAVDAARNIYVVDGGNERVQKFSYPTPNTIDVVATLDGAPWSGPVNFTLAGPQTVTGSLAPYESAPVTPGNYTISFVSGGPPSAMFVGASPNSSTLATGSTTNFTLEFRSTTNVKVVATLDGAPWAGPVNYTVDGVLTFLPFTPGPTYTGSALPHTFENVTEGTVYSYDPSVPVAGYVVLYTAQYSSGGPAGATLGSITPSPSQIVYSGTTETFSLNFWSAGVTGNSLVVNATLDGAPWSGPLAVQLQGFLLGSTWALTPLYLTAAAPHVFVSPPTGANLTDPISQATGPGGFYISTYLSGGPANAVLSGTTPTLPYHTYVEGHPKTFTYHFTSTKPTTGDLTVNATLDGAPWSGPLNHTLTGAASLSGASVPQGYMAQPPGSYTISAGPGGPPGAVLVGISPGATQTLAAGDVDGFTLHYRTRVAEPPPPPPPPPAANGTILIEATVAGAGGATPWVGAVNYTIGGPFAIGGASVPQTNAGVPVGTYTLTYLSGGPPGMTLSSITPSATQTLAANGTVTFRLNFR